MSLQQYKTVSVDTIKDSWKTQKVESHPIHFLCSRICSFPPAMPAYYIKKYTKKGQVVFDPWSGKGTVPFEALRNGRIGFGNDKSPEAYILTRAKVRPIKYSVFKKYVLSLKQKMNKTSVPNNLSELDKNAAIFYSKKTFEQILKLKKILKEDNSDKAIFTKAIIFGLLHGNTSNSFSLRCSHSYAMSPGYVQRYVKEHGLRRPNKDVISCILKRGELMLSEKLPSIRGIALKNDSTKIKLKSKSVDMILTSPPYFDVQTYAWANWLRLWFLGYDYKKIRKGLAESGSKKIYYDFMKKSISELYRVLKPKGKCFIVVGDITLHTKKGPINVNTAAFLSPICKEVGFKIRKIVKDDIPQAKKVNTYIDKNKGIKTERILYLIKS